MCDARYRRRPHELVYGTICPDCAGPKAEQASRCRSCWSENVLRANPRYWAIRTCPDCSGPKARNAARCRPCANQLLIGKPRTSPVVVFASHKWRRMRFGKAVLPTEAA